MDSERFFLRRHRVVNAGAGTGKTHALLTQYLHLLSGLTVHEKPLSPSSVCALTFTEKAAGELRERLGRRLRDIVKALAGEAEGGLATVEPALFESARGLGRELPILRHYEAARAQLSGAPIGTFHSFASGLLRRHAVAAQLDPDFSLLDEDAARDLLEESSERVVLAALDGQHGEALSQDAAQLVAEYGFRGGAHAEGGLVEALCQLHLTRAEEGQGTAGLYDAYTQPHLDAELARLRENLTGSLRALYAMSNELSGKSAERAVELGQRSAEIDRALSTFSGLESALPILAVIRPELGRLRAPKSKDGDDGNGERLKAIVAALKRGITDARALLASGRAAPLARGLSRLLDVLSATYTAQKLSLASLDFNDLLRRARDLLRDHPAARSAERSRYAALLVDEFQDTSPLQAELVELLVGFADAESTETAMGPRRLYLVGDRKQSIYGFRGADVTAYERLCQRLLAAGADEETLSVSRRSRPALLSVTNELFSHVFAQRDDSSVGQVLWDEARDPLSAFRGDPDQPAPLVEILRDAPPKEKEGAADEAATADDPMGREARLIARRITSFVDGGWRHGDIVLLLRRFTHLLRYTAALKQAAIPHYVVRGRGFYQAQEVLDLAAFLTVLDDPADRLALLTVLRSPLCGLSDESLVRLHLHGRLGLLPLLGEGQDVHTATETTSLLRDEADRLDRLLALLRVLLRSGDRLGPSACLRTLLDHTDYLAVLYADPDGEQRVANVLRLCERARSVELRGGNLRSFVRALRRDADPRIAEQRSERDEPTAPIASEAEDVVRIMTVHQSKGLEFPVVLLAGCASAERVDSPAIAYDRNIGLGLKVTDGGERVASLAATQVHELSKKRGAAESSRLFYVAATRARERLCLAGIVRRGRNVPSTTWMGHLEKAAERARETGAPQLVDWQWQPPEAPPAPPPVSVENVHFDSPVLSAAAKRYVDNVYPDDDLEEADTRVTLSVAAAADLAVCGRRFHLRHMMHLHEETPAAAPGRDEDPPGKTPLATLGCEVLGAIELQSLATDAAESAVQSQLLMRGHDLRALGVAELSTRLVRFLQSRYVMRELANPLRAVNVLQAQPYEVSVSQQPQAPRLQGVLDLLILDGNPPEKAQVVELRYGYAPDAPSQLDQLRQGLLRVVAKQLIDVPAKVGSCYLREADPQPQFFDEDDGEDAVQRLIDAAPLSRLGNTAALRLPVLDPDECQALRCGYLYVCHRRRS